MLELKPPHSPRSAVITTSRWTSSLPVPTRSRGALALLARLFRLASSRSMRSAYGRAATAASCARRSLAAATICMALVILRVAFTEAMRLRMSLREAIGAFKAAAGRRLRRHPLTRLAELLGDLLDHALQLGRRRIRQILAVADLI